VFFSSHGLEQENSHTKYKFHVAHEFSLVRLSHTYSSVDLTMMFLQESGFAFWKLVQSLPHGIFSYFDLYQTSFEKAKSLLEKKC